MRTMDARQLDGLSYYCDIVSREYREFASQQEVVPLSKNPRTRSRGSDAAGCVTS